MVDLVDALESVDLSWSLVGTKSQDSRKSQREATLVPIRFHHCVESDFQNDFRFHGSAESLVIYRVFEEPLGHLRDFRVGESRVGLANIQANDRRFRWREPRRCNR